jgi:hypothetical protein
MIRRRARDAGLSADICCHTFRTTQLYDRTGDEITLDEVERIAI